jgi:excisionase family DNA binding protein
MDGKEIRPPLSITEAARLLGVSDQTARLALIRGELDGFRIGRSWRIHPESVDRVRRGEDGDKPPAPASTSDPAPVVAVETGGAESVVPVWPTRRIEF